MGGRVTPLRGQRSTLCPSEIKRDWRSYRLAFHPFKPAPLPAALWRGLSVPPVAMPTVVSSISFDFCIGPADSDSVRFTCVSYYRACNHGNRDTGGLNGHQLNASSACLRALSWPRPLCHVMNQHGGFFPLYFIHPSFV